MTQFYRYRSTFGVALWISDLGNDTVRLGTLSITELAEHLQAGTSSITLDDPAATLGHSGDTIRGLQRFDIVETAEDVDNRRLTFLYIGQREYARGDSERSSLRTGASRQITLSLVDLNCIPGFAMFPNSAGDANRPSETVNARMTWLLATSHFVGNVYDEGLIASNTTVMDATNYQGQTAANVIGDMEIAAGFGWNAWMYFDEPTQHHAIGFLNANTSTLYSSTLRISNDLADIDTNTTAAFLTGTTFAANYDATLTRDPGEIVSRVYVAYADSTVYRTRAATEDIFGRRDLTAPNTNITSAAKAEAVGDDFLFQHSTEEDKITVKVEVPTSKVNHIKAGHRIQVKFTHLPGYESFTWCRVIRRTVIQEEATDRYTLDLDLSPQEAAAPASGTGNILQSASARGTHFGLDVTLPSAVTVGSTLVCLISTKLDIDPEAPNITGALARWGAGAWTRFNGSTTTSALSSEYGISAYYKTADATDQTGYIAEQNPAVAIYEIAGVVPGSATVRYADQSIGSANYDIGASQTPAVGDIVIAGWSLGPLPSPASYEWAGAPANGPVAPYQTTSPDPNLVTGLTLDFSKWVDDSFFGGYVQPSSPWTVFAHGSGAGTALTARVTPGESGNTFAGLYIRLPHV